MLICFKVKSCKNPCAKHGVPHIATCSDGTCGAAFCDNVNTFVDCRRITRKVAAQRGKQAASKERGYGNLQ